MEAFTLETLSPTKSRFFSVEICLLENFAEIFSVPIFEMNRKFREKVFFRFKKKKKSPKIFFQSADCLK